MANIFISYRRRDSAPVAKRIYEWLAARPNGSAVFMDLSGIEPGENFHEALRREIDAAEVMLVIIGKEWAFAEDADGMNRLDKPRDVVRREIAIGLESRARVVPVLVSGAEMPQAVHLPAALDKLTNLNAFPVNEETFEEDMTRLAEYLRKWTAELLTADPQERTEVQEIRPRMIQKKVCMLGAAGVGKTSLVSRYVRSIFSDKYLTTLGVKIDKKVITLGDAEINPDALGPRGRRKGLSDQIALPQGCFGHRFSSLMATNLHCEQPLIYGSVSGTNWGRFLACLRPTKSISVKNHGHGSTRSRNSMREPRISA